MSFEYSKSVFLHTGIQELNIDEIEQVNGGLLPVLVAAAVGAGAVAGAAAALAQEILDEREGVDLRNVFIGAVTGTGIALAPFTGGGSAVGTFVAGAGVGSFIGYVGIASTQSINQQRDGTVTVLAGCGGSGPCYDAN